MNALPEPLTTWAAVLRVPCSCEHTRASHDAASPHACKLCPCRSYTAARPIYAEEKP